jgi:phosphate starvation-inducible PhoH-like protein
VGKRKTGSVKQQPKYNNDSVYYLVDQEEQTLHYQPSKIKKNIDLVPQSVNQEKYIIALTDDSTDIVMACGPAGTGKTYLAMLTAIQSLRRKEYDKILLTRPAVAVDEEKHGFLPGDLNEKMEPWVRPLFDILRQYYSSREIDYMMEEQIIEIAPLAFCRGRTFTNSFIIADEMQNATPNQMKMIMTRIGEGSKIVITGDVKQTDRKSYDNGLLDLRDKLKNYQVPGLVCCDFDSKDIRRHPIIEHVLTMYGD